MDTKKFRFIALAAGLFCTAGVASAAAVTVYSNNPLPGDSFTNPGASNAGQAVESDWYYNNVRNSGIVGISNDLPRSGNGSARMQTTLGPASPSSKADIELLPQAILFSGNYFSGASLGKLSELTSLSYEWYRKSTSTNNAVQHPVIRILTDADGDLNTTDDRGGLVFELAYNGVPTAPTDTWVANSVIDFYGPGQHARLWSFGNGQSFEFGGYQPLETWVAGLGTISGNSAVIGFSMGVGSGWGPFDGAVDNVTIGFNGGATTYNFEVVPEPASLSVLALGAMGLLRRRR